MYARFQNNIWVADLAVMGSSFSKNQSVKYLFCLIDVFTKSAWVKPLKDGTAKALLHGFIEILNESSCQPNKLWVSEGRELTLCKNVYNNNWIIVHEYNNNYHRLIGKKPIDADYPALSKEVELQVTKQLSLKLVIESELLSTKIFLAKVALKIGQNKYLWLILCWKLIVGLVKLKI